MHKKLEKPPYLIPDWKVSELVGAAVTTRENGFSMNEFANFNLATHAGVDLSVIEKNRIEIKSWFDSGLQWQWLNQVHGNNAVRVSEASKSIIADAVVTDQRGLVCCVFTADCLPVFFAAKDGSEVGLAHAGWRGLSAGILEATVLKFNAAREDIQVWIGPGIGECHFEVGSDVRDSFLQGQSINQIEKLDSSFRRIANAPQKFLCNLRSLAAHTLNQLGVTEVSGGDFCTYCDEDRFYSYRRDSQCGRMLSMIYKKNL
ncbi:peptidoglycan editing factor PgeF [Gammaproteobacteria bacterium]|nr:peptidoglycan editing factor PgeF [Gammaproteobacteria bacterium]